MKNWKKGICLMLALVLTLGAGSALAAVPSKTTSALSKVLAVQTATGEVVPANFSLTVVEDTEPVIAEIEKLFAFAHPTEGVAAPIIEFFPEETRMAVENALPEETDIQNLDLNEFVSLSAFQHDLLEDESELNVSFEFATDYKPGQTLVALLGLYGSEMDEAGDYLVEWVVLKAEAMESGQVQVTFSKDIIGRIESAASSSLAILSTPADEEATQQ